MRASAAPIQIDIEEAIARVDMARHSSTATRLSKGVNGTPNVNRQPVDEWRERHAPRQPSRQRHDWRKKFARVDADRVTAGVSVVALCREAQLGSRTYFRLMNAEVLPHLTTVTRLDAALRRILRRREQVEAAAAQPLAALWHSFLALAALELKLDPQKVATADPRANQHGDADWTAAARARAYALTLCVSEMNLPLSAIARVAGISKQAVSKALKKIEEEREIGNAVDALLKRMARYLTKGAAA